MNHTASNQILAEYTTLCTGNNPNRALAALREKARSFRAEKPFPTVVRRKISNPFTVPGRGTAIQITLRVYRA